MGGVLSGASARLPQPDYRVLTFPPGVALLGRDGLALSRPFSLPGGLRGETFFSEHPG